VPINTAGRTEVRKFEETTSEYINQKEKFVLRKF
jgi:hypothetical protein